MKFIIETGQVKPGYNNACGLVASFANGRQKGNKLYKFPEFQRNVKWDYRNSDNYMVTSEYDLPEGTQIEIYGFCRVRQERTYWRRIFELTAESEVLDLTIDLPLQKFIAKGRLKLVADLRADGPIDYEGGF